MIQISDSTRPKGQMVIKIYRDGTLLSSETVDNLIVNGGKAALAHLLGNNGTGKHIATVGIGEGADPPAAEDTVLTGSVTVSIGETRIATGLEAEDGSLFDAPNIVQFHFNFDKATGNGIAIREYGLFCADGTLFSRIVRAAAFVKTDIDAIRGFWQIQF